MVQLPSQSDKRFPSYSLIRVNSNGTTYQWQSKIDLGGVLYMKLVLLNSGFPTVLLLSESGQQLGSYSLIRVSW